MKDNPNILSNYQKTNETKGENMVTKDGNELTLSKEELEFRTPEEKAHIAKIKEAIRNGEYRISSEDIAESILASV